MRAQFKVSLYNGNIISKEKFCKREQEKSQGVIYKVRLKRDHLPRRELLFIINTINYVNIQSAQRKLEFQKLNERVIPAIIWKIDSRY